MIPRALIIEWRSTAPWILDAQVEQDLVICRSLVALYSHPLLKESAAFRGGTALHKLHLQPASRYSEDIDLVQMNPGAVGPLLDAVQESLNPFLGVPRRAQKEASVMLAYRVESEVPPIQPLRVKIEINTREHFTVEGLLDLPFQVHSRWFEGACTIKTYSLAELLGTKLRALYQRRKGRDLFDLWLGITRGGTDCRQIVKVFQAYMKAEGHGASSQSFKRNMSDKLKTRGFLTDTDSLLSPGIHYDPSEAFRIMEERIFPLLGSRY